MPKKNAFFYFMIDYKKKEESKGRSFRSLAEVTPLAGAIWSNMNTNQRAPYVQQAKTGGKNSEVQEKLTNLGIPFSQIDAEKREKESKDARLKTLTIELVEKAVNNQALDTQNFYFISFAYFCLTANGYVPAELGVVRYSLGSGVKDKLHMHINPGPLPLGMAFEAQNHADEDHQLPIPPNAMGETDYDKIATALLSFLLQDGKMPLLFTDRDDVGKVENMLIDILGVNAEGMRLYVCPIAELFFQLKKRAQQNLLEQSGFPSVHIAQQIITKDVYDYTKGISCEYHDHRDNVKYCALSRCIRWAYVISDNCCGDMCIQMEPGKHLPLTADTTHNTTSMFDTISFLSQDDKCSFVSGSTVSRMTYPAMGGPGSSISVKAERQRADDHQQPKFSASSSSSSSARSASASFSSMLQQPKQQKQQEMMDETQSDIKTEVHETIKRETSHNHDTTTNSWGEPASKQRSHAGRGLSVGLNINLRGAGRGRGGFLRDTDEFPALGGMGRGRLFK
uniref:HMG box domain-containing protein n=1 Tax=Anopheles farauti TaxID=69004 RepID=A0A182Q4Y0_9DIPT